MRVALKIWRAEPRAGERELRDYEVEAPEWATLLDVLDIIKDRHDGTLAYRKSCRMMICGSCGMRMDGAAVLACKTRMGDDRRLGPRAGDLGDGEPADRQGPRRRHGAVLGEVPRGQPVPAARLHGAAGRARAPHLAGADERDPQGVALHQLRLLRLGVQRDGVEPRVPRARRRSPRRCASSATRATARRSSGSRTSTAQHGIWECTRCYFCNERCPKGVDPRDAIAKLGAESIKEGIDRDMGAKHAKWFVTSAKTTGWLRETELVPKTQGIVESIKQVRFALGLARVGKVPPPFPPHVAKDVRESRRLHDLLGEQDRRGYAGIVQGEAALARLAHGHIEGERDPYGAGLVPAPLRRRRGGATR